MISINQRSAGSIDHTERADIAQYPTGTDEELNEAEQRFQYTDDKKSVKKAQSAVLVVVPDGRPRPHAGKKPNRNLGRQ